MFWLACVDQMSEPNRRLWITAPLAFFSLSAFAVSIAVGADSAIEVLPGGAWPGKTAGKCVSNWKWSKYFLPFEQLNRHPVSFNFFCRSPATLLRTVLGLDLGVDLVILMMVLAQLRRMKSELHHLRKTLSKLSYIFSGMTTVSTLIIIAEFIINAPPSVSSHFEVLTQLRLNADRKLKSLCTGRSRLHSVCIHVRPDHCSSLHGLDPLYLKCKRWALVR